MIMSQILRMTRVPTIASTQEISDADQLVEHLAGLAVHQAERQHIAGRVLPSASLTRLVANTPVRSAPRVPPAPWTPKASSESS